MDADLNLVSKTLKIDKNEIKFCSLTESEYTAIYYDQMKKVGWKPIADAMKAHYILAKDSIFALKYKDRIIATLSAAKCPVFGVAYMGFFILVNRISALGSLGEKRETIISQVYALSSHGYSPL